MSMSKIITSMNSAAAELVKLDPVTQFEQVRTEQLNIYDMFYQLSPVHKTTDRYGNDRYYISELNITAPFETFLEAMEQLLRINKKTGKWNFKPENGDFVTTLIKRVKYFAARKIGVLKGIIPTGDDDSGEINYETSAMCNLGGITDIIAEFQIVAYIADLIMRKAWLRVEQENKSHFEGYFTHDTAGVIRPFSRAEIKQEFDDVLYPALCQKMLTFLIPDVINCVRDICDCRIRDGISLNQRNDNVAACYGMKSPKYYSGLYRDWIESVKPAV